MAEHAEQSEHLEGPEKKRAERHAPDPSIIHEIIRALMVWLLPGARSAKILVIALLTWLVAFAKLSHVIAGSAEAAYAFLTGDTDFASYWLKFLVPTLVGNTIGGVALVAMLNHAPVSADIAEDAPPGERHGLGEPQPLVTVSTGMSEHGPHRLAVLGRWPGAGSIARRRRSPS